MLVLLNNIHGQSFAEYISTCFRNADTFSLTKNGWSSAPKKESLRILQLLSPYHIRTLHTNHWFCYDVPDGYTIEVYLFKATPESKNILLTEYDSIFYNGAAWMKPEDLCFFKNGKLILGSVSHENICYAYDQEDNFGEQIKLHGEWEQVATDLTEQIQLPSLTNEK